MVHGRFQSNQHGGLFKNRTTFNEELNWDVSNVTNMSEMFYGCTSFTKALQRDGREWNVSNVTNMSGMFRNCRIMEDIGRQPYSWAQSIKKWNVSNVTDMSYMFSDCSCDTDCLLDFKWNVS